MKNIRGTVLGAFSIVIVISLLSSLISFFGYTKVIDNVNNIKINKSNQDKIQELSELSARRQQILTKCIVSMSDDGSKEFEESGKNIEDIAGKLSKAGISQQETKTVEDINSLNKQYTEIYTTKIASNIKAFDKKSIAGFSKSAQEKYNELKKSCTELSKNYVKQLEVRIGKAIDDNIDLNRREELVNSDSQYIDNEFAEIKKLLADILTQIQNSAPGDAIASEEFNSKTVDLKQRIAAASSSAQMVMENSMPVPGFNRIQNMKQILNDLQTYEKLNELIASVIENNSSVMYSASTFEDTSVEFKNNAVNIEQILGNLSKRGLEQKNINSISSRYASYKNDAEEVYKRTAIMQKADITAGYNSMTELNKAISEDLNKLRLSFNNYFADNIKTSENIKKGIFWILIGITIFSIVIGMLIAFLLSRKIANPINSLAAMLARVEKGDLTVRADISANNDIGNLGRQVNNVLDGQQKMVEQFKGTTKEISTLKHRLALLVSQNRESINRMSKYKQADKQSQNKRLDTESIVSDVKTVSEQTQKAVGDSIRAINVAKSREKTVEEAEMVINNVNETVKSIASSISKLESSSGKIGEITNTITQIASQTNLLALNAAIEANRAGQQGKGFAVVADEIRKLSNASNKSAGEIKEQIKEIQTSIGFAVEKMNMGVVGVEDGATRINEVKEGITEIIESVNLVADAIKASADRASTNYTSTMQFVEVVDNMTKLDNETASAGENINDIIEMQANTLKDLDQISNLLHDASAELVSISERVKV